MKNVKAILFAEGFVSVSLQFLFMRHLLPQVGSSVVVSTIVVSIFLMFLSLGYHFGGKVTQRHEDQLSRNLLLAALTLCLGLSPLLSKAFFFFAGPLIGLNVSLALYLVIFMAPAVYLLGQTMPLLANLVKAETSGKVSATVLVFSTVGNVIGSLISVLILMRYLGLGMTSFLNIVVLLGLYFVLSKRTYTQVIVALVVSVIAYGLIYGAEKNAYDKTNQYANYKVLTEKDAAGLFLDGTRQGRILLGNDLPQSVVGTSGVHRTTAYIEFIQGKIRALSADRVKVLVVGSGGFTVSLGDKKNTYTYVDIDDQLQDYAERHFLGEKINGTFKPDDARKYLIENNQQQDVIILDAFHSKISIPQHLMTQEYFQLVKERVRQGGLVIINTIQAKGFSDDYSFVLNNTINSVFPACTATEVDAMFKGSENSGFTNLVYVCYNNSGPEAVFADDRLNMH